MPIDVAALVARIHRCADLTPEQVMSAVSDETDAVLIDQWARQHPLRVTTVIGRDAANPMALLHASVSRRHAELVLDEAHDTWTIVDLGSRNGTVIDGTRLAAHAPHALRDTHVIAIGDIELAFLADRTTLAVSVPPIAVAAATVESVRGAGVLRLSAPTVAGSGIVHHGKATISLGSSQFALLRLLAERYLSSLGEDREVRGFIRSIELITSLPWNSPHPDDNHVKQQVRRLRRALEHIGLPDAIESRHGFGYRLRVVPMLG